MLSEHTIELLKNAAQELVRAMRLDLHMECTYAEDTLQIRLQGSDNACLLQKNGEALYALEYMLNRMFEKQLDGEAKIIVDCAQFRKAREEELRLLAIKACEKVIQYGQAVNLQPMPANERRIIHLTLADQTKVKTMSEGVGEWRKVIIAPAGR